MPMIYKRFTEKSAEEWRQIYKALQLLEFLVKHGSERVIDDVRSHLSLIKMLRQFHYIDQNGKDQGLNVRNRSKELTDLMGDVDRIRAERKKARASRGKYGGVEGGAGLGSSTTSAGRYGGFGSESGGYGGYSGGVFGDGGGFGGAEVDDDDSQSRQRGADRFDEYDEYNEGSAAPPPRRKTETSRTTPAVNKNKAQPPPPKPKEPEVDLFSFDEPEQTLPAPVSNPNGKAPATPGGDFGGFQTAGADDDDDFDDFQSAAPAAAPAAQSTAASARTTIAPLQPPAPNYNIAAPTPLQAPAAKAQDFSSIFSTTSQPPSQVASPAPSVLSPQSNMQRPSGYQAAQPNYFTSVSVAPAQSTPSPSAASSGMKSPLPGTGGQQKKKAAGGDAFASLLSGSNLKKNNAQGPGMTMQEMAKQKASAGLWGTAGTPATGNKQVSGGQQQQQQQQPRQGGGAMDDLLG